MVAKATNDECAYKPKRKNKGLKSWMMARMMKRVFFTTGAVRLQFDHSMLSNLASRYSLTKRHDRKCPLDVELGAK